MLTDKITARAKVRIRQERLDANGIYQDVGGVEEVSNLLTDVGRVQLHAFCYGTAPRSNGFNYIGITDDATAPSPSDTVLAGELSGNGLTRAQGVVILPVGTGTLTQVTHVFTYTGVTPQGVRKAALFNLASGGTMNHEVVFSTPRTLLTNDNLVVTFLITLA
jgi:hypothetical protein